MAELNPPLWITGQEHPGDVLRYGVAALLGNPLGGVAGASALAVTALSPSPDMAVDVAAGTAFVAGTVSPDDQGFYVVPNVGSVELAISPADPTNARIDLVVARVYDDNFAGASAEWALEVVTGTPAGSPVAPTAPDNCLVLAQIAVAANEDAIESGHITDLRVTGTRGRAYAVGGTNVCTSASRPTNPNPGDSIFELDTGRFLRYRSGSWQDPRLDPAGCVVQRSATQSFTDDIEANVSFTAADLRDTDGFHDPTSNADQVTIPAGRGGWYTIVGTAAWQASSAGRRQHRITVNNSEVWATRLPPVNAGVSNIPIAAEILVADGDVLRFPAAQTSGGDLTLTATVAIRRVAEAS